MGLYGAYRAADGYNTAYSPVSSYSSAYGAPVESYSGNYVSNSAYAPVQSYRNTYETVDYQPATTYASPDYSTGYRTGYSAPAAAYAGYGTYGAGYGLNYGSYAPKDGKLVSVIDR